MVYLKKLSFLALVTLLACSCTNTTQSNWTQAISDETSFVIIPSKDAVIDSVLQSRYLPFLEDVSGSAIPLISKIDSAAGQSLSLKSILLYPATGQKLQPIWVAEAVNDLRERLKNKYAQKFTQNEYYFHDTPILKLQIESRWIFIAQISNLLLISESSLGIEKSIRAYRGTAPAADLSRLDMQAGSIIINTPSLDKWAAQLARVTYAPALQDAFEGTTPALLTFTDSGSDEENQLKFTGTIPLTDGPESPLISALSYEAKPITLDAYISSKAAAFGIMHAAPAAKPTESLPDTTAADAFLLNNTEDYDEFANTLEPEFGLVMYAESGFLTTGEHLFIRKLKDAEKLRAILEELSNRGSIEKVEEVYFVQSYLISRLIGSPLSNFKDFYLKIIGDAVVASKRKGLAETVASDRSRRRVMIYEQTYKEIRKNVPEQLSSLFIAGPEFNSFLSPFLAVDSYVDALTSPFSYLALTTKKDESQQRLAFTLSTYKTKKENKPYRENWLFPTNGAELSGEPVFGNVGGSYINEVVFATKTGSVYVLAADGTLIQEYSTGRDVPMGSPIVYDWYGNGENVILLAAGSKIYGWDDNGDLLPKFPFELNEQITTPLTIADLNENRLPDAIVATADRKLHALNGRGNNLRGWPVTTNARIRSAPVVDYFENTRAVIAFSSNAVHAWNATGDALENFPTFVNAALNGSPLVFEDTILGNAVDGNLYAIGGEPQFSDSLDVSGNSSQNVQAVYVSNSSLTGTPSVAELTVKKDGTSFSEKMILTTSSNGSLFLLSPDGQLRLTKSMGQPSADNWSSFITDINSDGKSDIVALANYGRLYAWSVETGERIFNLPTAGMSQLNITDLDGDGLKELVAQTEDGVQSWTIDGGQ
jgi:hypothetical protein